MQYYNTCWGGIFCLHYTTIKAGEMAFPGIAALWLLPRTIESCMCVPTWLHWCSFLWLIMNEKYSPGQNYWQPHSCILFLPNFQLFQSLSKLFLLWPWCLIVYISIKISGTTMLPFFLSGKKVTDVFHFFSVWHFIWSCEHWELALNHSYKAGLLTDVNVNICIVNTWASFMLVVCYIIRISPQQKRIQML